MDEMFAQLRETNVTKTIHRRLYPAISPNRPELSQAGKVVLIPGGGTGVGYGIARSFVQASADAVILIGRRVNILEEAAAKLEEEAKKSNTNTRIIKQACDVTNLNETRAFWDSLTAKGITVDVLIANVAKGSTPESIFELGSDEVWSQMEVNVKSHLYFTEQFYSQPNEKRKVGKELSLICSSSPGIWNLAHNTNRKPVVSYQCFFFGNPHDSSSWSCPTPGLYIVKNGCNASFPSHRPEHACYKITSY